MTTYLAGPIRDSDDPQSWRRRLTQLLDGDVINPLDIEDFSDNTEPPVDVVDRDIAAIREADAVVVYRECDVETWGTPMEMRVASQSDCDVVGFNPSGTDTSPWFRYHADVVVESYTAVRAALSD